ncbi:MAG: cysteine synthase family protein [Actinobacteria bacterium]|nr:cysteine synthase family protein [Actinomycetota bacterium]
MKKTKELISQNSLLSAIGNTPLIELRKVNPFYPDVRLFAKYEGANPGGSVKDRPALYMILDAEEKGLLTPEKIVVEPTSGNTGIALAMICALKGYRIRLYMPACVSIERRRILEALGAEVILTPAEESTDGAIRRAYELIEKDPTTYFMPDQFRNPANVLAHYETTGPEIYEELNGNITAFAAGLGTTGTFMGVGTFLKEKNSSIILMGIEPVKKHRIQGLKNMEESIVPLIYDPDLLDEHIFVNDAEAFEMARRLAHEEGLFVGMSSGAAVFGALKLAEKIKSGNIVTILPDRGDRYLSTSLFASICSECPP